MVEIIKKGYKIFITIIQKTNEMNLAIKSQRLMA
jgi:hypothetical protein